MKFAGCLPIARLQIMICKRDGSMEFKDRYKNMLDKIKRHEKSNMHLHASAACIRWKVGKDFSEENEN